MLRRWWCLSLRDVTDVSCDSCMYAVFYGVLQRYPLRCDNGVLMSCWTGCQVTVTPSMLSSYAVILGQCISAVLTRLSRRRCWNCGTVSYTSHWCHLNSMMSVSWTMTMSMLLWILSHSCLSSIALSWNTLFDFYRLLFYYLLTHSMCVTVFNFWPCNIVKCSICCQNVRPSIILMSYYEMVQDIKTCFIPYDRGMFLVYWGQILQPEFGVYS